MGLPLVLFYQSETILDQYIDILILKAFNQTTYFAEGYMEEQVEKMATENGQGKKRKIHCPNDKERCEQLR